MAYVSYEYFPPRSEAAKGALKETVDTLSQYQPEFQSVTYGAVGSNREGSLETIKSMRHTGDIAGHFTYTGSSLEDVTAFANDLWEAGVKRLVALRGDDRLDVQDSSPFSDTADFIKTLISIHPFEIAVACYPETHPLAQSRVADIENLKAKQDAGASLAITQFFFDNSVFYEFVEEAKHAGITIPIVPGILPIYNFKRVCIMAEKCGASIPVEYYRAFAEQTICGSGEFEIASELLKAQVQDLACAGFEHIHIYTLNRAELAVTATDVFLEASKFSKVA